MCFSIISKNLIGDKALSLTICHKFPQIMRLVNRSSIELTCFEINSISCLAIEFFLKNSFLVKKHIENIQRSKNFLIKELSKLNINFRNTYANFFHIELGKNTTKLEKEFKKKGILFRKGPGVKGFEKYSRFSLGSPSQMKKVLQLAKNVHRKN